MGQRKYAERRRATSQEGIENKRKISDKKQIRANRKEHDETKMERTGASVIAFANGK